MLGVGVAMAELMPELLNMRIVNRTEQAIWLRLPLQLQRVIEGGCQCSWCKAHPSGVPTWDTLAVPIAGPPTHAWVIHAPDYPKRDPR